MTNAIKSRPKDRVVHIYEPNANCLPLEKPMGYCYVAFSN